MKRSRAFVLAMVLALSSAVVAGEDAGRDLLRVFPGQRGPDDLRLVGHHDVDHPADFKPHFMDRAAWEARAQVLRRQVLVANGLWPMPEKTPLAPVIHGKIDRDGYTVEKVYFASLPGHYVSGNLYRPKDTGDSQRGSDQIAKHPGVLCPHGHWPGGRFMWETDKVVQQAIESGAEKSVEGARSPLQARCATLARMGCVVFHYDLLGYADSAGIEHRKGFTDVESVLRLQSQMGLQTWNSIRSLDFLAGLRDVDPARLAVTGASGGGTQTFILSAVDDRVSAAFPAVMVGMNMQGGCVCENAPLLRVGTNNVELAALFAPKPLGMSAADDWTVDLETRGLPELKAIYKLYDAADRVTARHFPFPHNYNQVSREFMYGWFNKHLKLGQPEPVKERPFEPVPPAQLSVYDAEHPRPADAADAGGVRRYMTESSDRQMEALEKNPEHYRTVVSGAVRAMVADELPGDGEILAGRLSGPRPTAGHVVYEKACLTRRNGGEAVPAAILFPGDWDGTVVIWAHPDGKSSLLGNDGKWSPAVQKLLDGKAAVLSADLYLTGEYRKSDRSAPANPTYSPSANPPYAAFDLGYNRGILANRVHDLQTEIAVARGFEGTRSVRLVGLGNAGPWALIARSIAGDAIDRAAIDLDRFDFDNVKQASDDMLVPGALKYGGIYGLVPLCTHGQTLLVSARKTGKSDLAARTKDVTLVEESRSPADLAEWVLK